ncbi:MAG TPA: VOC family protein [Vicinamibacterales bacterium]|jgi:PhnB protein|nr:VOC family protein [Vicinamibacterales bacterium]
MAKAKSPVPQGLHTVTPHLILDDAATAIDWYKRGFGADEISRSAGPDGKIMHAEIRIGNSHLYLNDAMGGGKGPKALGGSPIGLWLYVEDADALFNRAVSAGATVAPGPMGQMQDQFWGDRCGTLIDPAGFQWTIATRKEDLTPDELNRRADEFFKQFASMAKE